MAHRCWGKSFRGQLGRGEYIARGKYPGEMGTGLTAVDLGTNVTATSLAAGSDHTCAALVDGSLKVRGRAAGRRIRPCFDESVAERKGCDGVDSLFNPVREPLVSIVCPR